MNITAASELARHSRVVLNLGDTPHLVDRVTERPSGDLVVEFSSGEFRTYEPSTPVVTV